MAKKQTGNEDDILLNINVTGREQIQGARDDAKGLNQELKDGGKADLSEGVKSLRTQLKEAKMAAEQLLLSGKGNTKEYAEAAKKVGELKDAQEELNNTYKSFNPDNKFQVFNSIAGAGAKAVQGYAGAMAFLGVKGEDATETLAKLQGIMAFSDAISSLEDLKDGYSDLLRVLGFTKTGVIEQEAAVAAETEAEVVRANTIIALEERVAAARVAASTTSAAAEQAYIAVQAEGLDATIAGTTADVEYIQAATARRAAVVELTAAEEALALATAQGAVAAEGQAVAMAGVTVAEEGATAASFTLGAALKAIGIGLIISLIAYLISNWKEVKKAVTDLFPALKDTGELFDKFKQIIFGVGNAILQFIVAPIKAFIKLIQGDFKAAMGELAKGADFAKNYEDGATKEAAAQAEARRVERVKKEIEANERIIKERKALGENTTALEVANQKRRISILQKDADDYEKQKADAITDLTVIQNTEWKRQNDLFKAKLKADLDEIKKNALDSKKVIEDSSENQRKILLADLDFKYAAELSLLNKRKSANKDYNKDYALIVSARKAEEAKINKQYDDAYLEYQKQSDQAYFSNFEKKEIDIRKSAENALKNATDAQKANILSTESFLLGKNKDEANQTSVASKASTNLIDAENANRPSDRDTPDEARKKVSNLADARREAENQAYELNKLQLEGQYDELERIRAEHEKSLTDINQEQAEARKEIARLETENRLKLFDAVASGASTASDLIGESTIAGKALAIASATISTYSAIAGQLAAFSGVPIPGYAIAQAIATGLVGLANVKKILSVKVPGKSGSSGSSGSAPTAPTINSTVLQQDKSGSNNVVKAVNDKNNDTKPLKAYITNKDLEDQKKQTDYYNSQSTY